MAEDKHGKFPHRLDECNGLQSLRPPRTRPRNRRTGSASGSSSSCPTPRPRCMPGTLGRPAQPDQTRGIPYRPLRRPDATPPVPPFPLLLREHTALPKRARDRWRPPHTGFPPLPSNYTELQEEGSSESTESCLCERTQRRDGSHS